MVSAVGSLLIGSLGAYIQTKIKRFFAYSSLNQLGFILLGLSNNFVRIGLISVFFFIVVYLLNNILFFYILFKIRKADTYNLIINLSDLKGFSFFFLRKVYICLLLFFHL